MKTSLFIFVIASIISLSSIRSQSQSPVLDTDGKPLVSGNNYYIVPAMSGRGGGFKLVPTTQNQTCPLDVVQENNEHLNGQPLSFSLAVPFKGGVVRESADVNIIFTGATSCDQPAVWRVEEAVGHRVVSSRGNLGGPSPGTVNNWFKIEKFENSYKIVFCPKVCNTCRLDCGDVGSKIAKNGRISLVLNTKPLKVKFIKA
ncbi:proteinase inhibitor I3 [Artemisia annua]|uniref:Proteinase inhibitor I3 n=1 Tax=Artemisia annua TaxID=35608 RepID=A0A2U1KJJ7_ARTAN|nr:proteinase inhibitor I3 [Artemisia annua]